MTVRTAPDGLIVVDKPTGLTSHDVVARIRRLAATRKVGHAGTLDPMATGVLVLGIGKATRLLTHIVGADKTYEATIRLGVATDSDDADGQITSRTDSSEVTDSAVRAGIADLTGDIQQVPNTVSAIKVDGQRSYALAREGRAVELKARSVRVSRFDVHQIRRVTESEIHHIDVDVMVQCSTGTYIRALARDLGAALGVGGHLVALRRTRVGGYELSLARDLDALARQVEDAGELRVMPLAEAAAAIFPTRSLTPQEVIGLGYGKRIRCEPAPTETVPTETVPTETVPTETVLTGTPAPLADGTILAGVSPEGELIALVTVAGSELRPSVVFAPN